MMKVNRITLIKILTVLVAFFGVSLFNDLSVLAGRLNPRPSIFNEAPYNRSRKKRPKKKLKKPSVNRSRSQSNKPKPIRPAASLPSRSQRTPVRSDRPSRSTSEKLPCYEYRAPVGNGRSDRARSEKIPCNERTPRK